MDNSLIGLNEYMKLDISKPFGYTTDILSCIVILIHTDSFTIMGHIESYGEYIKLDKVKEILNENNNVEKIDLFIGRKTSDKSINELKELIESKNINYSIYSAFNTFLNQTSVGYNYVLKKYYLVDNYYDDSIIKGKKPKEVVMKREKKGFTLVELLVVIAILAILAILSLPNVFKIFNSSKKNVFLLDTKNMAKEAEMTFISESIDGNTILSFDSNTDTKLSGSNTDKYTYVFEMDNNGRVSSISITDGKYRINSSKFYTDLTIDDIEEIDSSSEEQNSFVENSLAEKIINDNDILSDTSINFKQSSFHVLDYITKRDDNTTYYYNYGNTMYFSNQYHLEGEFHNLEDYSEITLDEAIYSNTYFCEENYFCTTMYEIADPSTYNGSGVEVYIHSSVPNQYVENGKGLYYANNESARGRYYYFRGNVTNNYVRFMNETWRIVRVNPDGSVRLIMNGPVNSGYGYNYNSSTSDSRYVGFMYGDSSDSYANSTRNINASNMLNTLNFMINAFISTMPGTLDYLADNGFCYDRSLADQHGFIPFDSFGSDEQLTSNAQSIMSILRSNDFRIIDSQLGYGTNETFYAPFYRIINGTPSLECKNKNDLFTVNNNAGNRQLTYPVGLLTADEAIYAGAESGNLNKYYYLYNTIEWWMFSPLASIHNPQDSSQFVNTIALGSRGLSSGYATDAHAIRFVIDLKPTVLYNGGNGTSSSPYTVTLE